MATNLCDVKVLYREAVLDAFAKFPEERTKLEEAMTARKKAMAKSMHRRQSVEAFTGLALQECEQFKNSPLEFVTALASPQPQPRVEEATETLGKIAACSFRGCDGGGRAATESRPSSSALRHAARASANAATLAWSSATSDGRSRSAFLRSSAASPMFRTSFSLWAYWDFVAS